MSAPPDEFDWIAALRPLTRGAPAALGLLDDHARVCVLGGEDSEREQRAEEMMAAVGRLLRRG